ncbi:MAG: hypothetical protein JWQ09_951 [Segetibacter sp.]|nr:hypothetical protein [Segetibacter sp.]
MSEFRSYPKPLKGERKKKTKTKRVKYSVCSDGWLVTEATIKANRSQSYREKHAGNPEPICEGCGQVKADDNSHIIAQRRLKILHKTELIWDKEAYCSYCRECHKIWESPKSGEFMKLNNIDHALEFLKQHDNETYIKVLNWK